MRSSEASRCPRYRGHAIRPGLARLCLAALALTAAVPALGHKASDAYLDLRGVGESIDVRWDVAIRDIDSLVSLDADADGQVRWSDLSTRLVPVTERLFAGIGFTTSVDGLDRSCPAGPVTPALAQRSDGAYLALRFSIRCPGGRPSRLGVDYRLLADLDPTHRAIVSVDATGGLTVLRPTVEGRSVVLDLRSTGSADTSANASAERWGPAADLGRFFVEGFRHILYGPDHLAFLFALLVAALAVDAGGGSRSMLARLLMTITVFTVAHSITLVLTGLGWLAVPSRWVEAAVAGSVVVAGLQAFVAATRGCAHRLAKVPPALIFGFGLVHGIGFGSTLGESGLVGRAAVTALLGFNLGVEAGQVAALAAVLPLGFLLNERLGFRRWGLPLLALAVVLAGTSWLVSRLGS